MAADDRRLRDALAADGSLFQFGYHPQMEALHLPEPRPIEEPEGVDERRRRVGLEPLADALRRRREGPPEPLRGGRDSRRREFEEWARSARWRD